MLGLGIRSSIPHGRLPLVTVPVRALGRSGHDSSGSRFLDAAHQQLLFDLAAAPTAQVAAGPSFQLSSAPQNHLSRANSTSQSYVSPSLFSCLPPPRLVWVWACVHTHAQACTPTPQIREALDILHCVVLSSQHDLLPQKLVPELERH